MFCAVLPQLKLLWAAIKHHRIVSLLIDWRVIISELFAQISRRLKQLIVCGGLLLRCFAIFIFINYFFKLGLLLNWDSWILLLLIRSLLLFLIFIFIFFLFQNCCLLGLTLRSYFMLRPINQNSLVVVNAVGTCVLLSLLGAARVIRMQMALCDRAED